MINVTENIQKFLEEPTRDKKILKVLKNDHRSYVYMFELDNKKYVYKEPKEKNNRKWQKFLNFFRGSESKREFFQMKKINMLGLKTATPIYFEKEFLIYEFIEGHKPDLDEVNNVVEELKKIHSLGYLHGDSHLDNFLISDKSEKIVYIIDSKFQKNKYGKFGEIFELMYLEDSLGFKIELDRNSFYYKMALAFRNYLTFFSKIKNIIRRR